MLTHAVRALSIHGWLAITFRHTGNNLPTNQNSQLAFFGLVYFVDSLVRFLHGEGWFMFWLGLTINAFVYHRISGRFLVGLLLPVLAIDVIRLGMLAMGFSLDSTEFMVTWAFMASLRLALSML